MKSIPLKPLCYLLAYKNWLDAGFFERMGVRLFGEVMEHVDELGHRVRCGLYKGKVYMLFYEA